MLPASFDSTTIPQNWLLYQLSSMLQCYNILKSKDCDKFIKQLGSEFILISIFMFSLLDSRFFQKFYQICQIKLNLSSTLQKVLQLTSD